MTRVLVVDDEPQIVRALAINLRARKYEVFTAGDGAGALATAASHPPDLVILDLGLPDIDGVDVIRGLRGWTTAPIVILSGRTDSADKVEALDAGADDYVTKPFGVDELLARMRAVSRRTSVETPPSVTFGRTTVDLAGRRVTVQDGRPIHRRPAHPNRVAPAGGPPASPRQADEPTPAPCGGLGAGLRNSSGKPTALHGQAAPQGRARPRATSTPAHRTRHGLPLPAGRLGHNRVQICQMSEARY